MLRSLLKTSTPAQRLAISRFASTAAAPTTSATQEPISAPTLRKLDTRWEKLTEEDRDEIIDALAERQKGDWKQLTPLEKKAAWYISYGEWGPRRPVHAKGDTQRIVIGTLLGVGAAFTLFCTIRSFMPEKPKTMAAEWQQATNDELEAINAEPFKGFNQIQSPPTGISASDVEDDDDE